MPLPSDISPQPSERFAAISRARPALASCDVQLAPWAGPMVLCASVDGLKERGASRISTSPSPVLSKCTYLELNLLEHIDSSDVFISPLATRGHGYFVTELLGTDLYRLLASRRPLEKHIQYFLYQILRGLKNRASSSSTRTAISKQDSQMTGYVSTRYYRAPEIMLTWQKYDVAVDIRSAGYIFAAHRGDRVPRTRVRTFRLAFASLLSACGQLLVDLPWACRQPCFGSALRYQGAFGASQPQYFKLRQKETFQASAVATSFALDLHPPRLAAWSFLILKPIQERDDEDEDDDDDR
ncbi:hypothetical protein L227DRAFT_561684 [Lentinus tigrinus ALCF2SS1-6]|uniref:Protein kinase domain-containing protein n=1 Tax=Lentinus tigrinus ALCF2SS1-6 TaxID=1328759 RepID=A0A5C2SI06_9APHY|nr:hypothetical protein L227DRAFT_561684 [Lentinus tigrinus ALCF2SS1-6]